MQIRDLEATFEKSLHRKKKFVNPLEALKQTGLKPNMVAADFGCGTGYLSFAAAKIINPAGKVFAVDVRRDALRSIESQKKLFGERNIKTVLADLMIPGSTKIPDLSVDLVILATIMFQLPKLDPLFVETKRVLKKGGEILIIEWKKERIGGFGPFRERRIDQKEMEKIIARQNLEIIHYLKTDPYHYGYVVKEASGAR